MIRHEIKEHTKKMMARPEACPVHLEPKEARMCHFFETRKIFFVPSGTGVVTRKPINA